MDSGVIGLARPRRGHFDLGTGFHGDVWLEVAFLPAYRAQAGPRGSAPAYSLPDIPGGIAEWRVAIADDAVNAGTAVRACADLLRNRGAVPVAVAALLSLGPASATVAEAISVPLYTAGQMQSQAWPAAQCPLCAGDNPADRPTPV